MPSLATLHDEANEAIRRLDEALAEESDADGEHRRTTTIQPLSKADYGRVEGCDEALAAVETRIDALEDLPDDTVELAVTRREALDACRRLWTQRSRLAAV